MVHAAAGFDQVVGRRFGTDGFDKRRIVLRHLSGDKGGESGSHCGVAL